MGKVSSVLESNMLHRHRRLLLPSTYDGGTVVLVVWMHIRQRDDVCCRVIVSITIVSVSRRGDGSQCKLRRELVLGAFEYAVCDLHQLDGMADGEKKIKRFTY